MNQTAMDLSIIIVSWNVRSLLERCLMSIAESMGGEPAHASRLYEVIVVDNGSTDGAVEWLGRSFPWVIWICNASNVGFGRANNQGMAAGRGRYLLLLNPDTEVVGDGLPRMLSYMDAEPGIGALGPMLRYPDGGLQSSRRRFPTYATGFFESTVLQPCRLARRLLRRYYLHDGDDDATQDVDWLVGACLMIRREAYAQVGQLDERFFMYSEEVEFQHRLREAGWRVVYLPAAQVIHHEGKSSEQVAAQRLIMFHTSKVQLYEMLFGRPRAAILRIFLLGTFVFQWAREALKWLLGHRRPLRRERMAAYAQVLRSGLRPARLIPPQLPGRES
jgi:N-acetylglucosaminyl-diphospho-decaprenol L-rhamnosyltransferase